MLKAEDICKAYFDRSSGRRLTVLDHCSLEVRAGEALALMGKSGSGKSTLARIMLRLLPCDSGSVSFEGRELTREKNSRLKDFRQQVQLISQRPESFFDPLMRLGDSLREPLKIFHLHDRQDGIDGLLELVKLNRAVLQRYPHQVSGGEIQRLSLARALLLEPRLLVLDEPTSMLDISVQAQILQLLKSIRREKNLSYLLITHDRAVASWLCDRAVNISGGRIGQGCP